MILAKQRWEGIGETEDLDQMVDELTNCMTKALDEIAPVKQFTIRPEYKKGVTDQTNNILPVTCIPNVNLKS